MGSDFPSYFLLGSSSVAPPLSLPPPSSSTPSTRFHARALCYMSRGEWPLVRPPTHFLQHSLTQSRHRNNAAVQGRNAASRQRARQISDANRSTGLREPAQRRTSILLRAHTQPRHQHSRGASPRRVPVSSSRVRKNAAVGQLRGFTSSPGGPVRTRTTEQAARKKERERERGGGRV